MRRLISWSLGCFLMLLASSAMASVILGPKANTLPNATFRVLPNGTDAKAEVKLVPAASLRGKPIALLYWKVGDSKSETELKVFQKLATLPTYKGKVHFLSAVKASSAADIKAATKRIRELKLSIPTVMDRNQLAPYLEAWFGFPRYGLVDKDGRIVVWHVAHLTETIGPNYTFMKALQQLAAGKKVPAMRGTTKLKNTHQLIGKKIPNVGLNDEQGKATTTMKYHKGKPLLLAFWSVTCPHCRQVIPVVGKYWHARKGNVDLVTITRAPSDSLKKMIRDLFKEKGFSWGVSYAPENATLGFFNIVKVPTVILADKKGIIRYVWIQPDAKWIEGAIESAFVTLAP